MATCNREKIGQFQVALEIKLNATPGPCLMPSLSANKLYQMILAKCKRNYFTEYTSCNSTSEVTD